VSVFVTQKIVPCSYQANQMQYVFAYADAVGRYVPIENVCHLADLKGTLNSLVLVASTLDSTSQMESPVLGNGASRETRNIGDAAKLSIPGL
jgi:hypothetical protein